MTHPKFFKGKHFNYDLDPGDALRPNPEEGTTDAADQNITTHLRSSANGATQDPWSFTFLKHWSGAITRAQFHGPILTGPMTGCILCSYLKHGEQRIAHIGTAISPQDPNTISVKNAWSAYMADGVSQVKGRKPTQAINDHDVIAEVARNPITVGSPVPQIWGYFVNPNEAWALLIRKTTINNQVSNEIVTARPMQLQAWNRIPGSW